MNRARIGVTAGCLAAAAALAADPTNTVPLRLAVDLADGSHLIGIPSADTLRVQTPYAKLDLRFSLLRRIRLLHDQETVSVEFANGDRVTGIPDLAALSLRTLFGEVRVPAAEVRTIAVLAESADDRLVLYYSFDRDKGGQVLDQSGLGNDASAVGPVGYEDGVRGRAVRFTNKDTYILSAARDLNMHDWREATVSVWVKPMAHTTYGHVISRGPVDGDGLGAFWLALGSSYGKGNFGVLTAAATERGLPDPWTQGAPPDWGQNLPPGRWHHLALVYDGAGLRYYINGDLARAVEGPRSDVALRDRPDTKLMIGTVSQRQYIGWSDMYFDGTVDEVRIYRKALTPEEIRRLASR